MYIRNVAAALLGVVFLSVSVAWAQDGYIADVQPIVVPTPENSVLQSANETQASSPAKPYYNDSATVPCETCQCTGECGCTKEKKKKLAAAAAAPYKGVSYANDFSYVNDPCYDGWHLGERLKNIQLCDNTTLSFGGEYRSRFHNEGSMRGSQGRVNNFLLHRSRIYGDLQFKDFGRIFVEGIDAQSNYEVLAPRGIDENRYDFLNAFADLRVLDTNRGNLTARYGRQELLYGAQRVISPLDWGNTRRTFEGYKAIWKGDSWKTDFFYVNPMNTRVNAIDTRNENVELMGSYASYKGIADWALDFYYVGFNDSVANFSYDTYGARAQGAAGGLLYDLEGAYQGGADAAGSHDAGYYTLGVGKKFANAPWSPTIFAYYDWASGARGNSQGYHHVFPLAHKYNGFMDLFGRRNLEDINIQCVMSPAKKWKLLSWYHIFNRVETTDTPYNVGMASYGTANGGKELGQEIDMLLSYSISPRSNVAFGYSHFFSGAYFDANPGIPFSSDADFFYTQYTIQF